MPEFVSLVDQMLLSHVFQLMRSSLSRFVDDILEPHYESSRIGLFRAKLVFSSHSKCVKYLSTIRVTSLKTLRGTSRLKYI